MKLALFIGLMLGTHCGDEGEYDVGPYHCCGPDQSGTECCSGKKKGFCFRYGGPYGDCRAAGEQYDGKEICAKCCSGLTPVGAAVQPSEMSYPEYPEGCGPSITVPPSLIVCIACGDDMCRAGENQCNCPQDCRGDGPG